MEKNLVSSIVQGQGSSIGKNHNHYKRHMDNAPLSPGLSCACATYDYPPSTPSPITTPPSATQSLRTTSQYVTQPRDESGSIGNLPFVDGLVVERVVRAYRMVQRTQKPHQLRQRGQSHSRKVELLSVQEAIRTGGCK
jgi:hypothetical protein